MRETKNMTDDFLAEVLAAAGSFAADVGGALGLIALTAEQGGHGEEIAGTARLARYAIDETAEDLKWIAGVLSEEDGHEAG